MYEFIKYNEKPRCYYCGGSNEKIAYIEQGNNQTKLVYCPMCGRKLGG